jgi:alpha-glucosidase
MSQTCSDGNGPWWRDAVVYQVYPRSFASAVNPDGVGDLRGLIDHLDHVVDLGADALWLSPIFRSPQADHGYDVADYCDIDPLFGTMADFDRLLTESHARGLRVTIDMVPNHTSDQHPWFRAALAAGRGSPERDRYLFRDGRGPSGDLPPTDVVSSFGGPAWTRVDEPDGRPGQWYFHLFAGEQPDLNWAHPEVLAEFERVWRFWLDKGVDGFRVDVADHLTKDPDRTDKAEGNHLLEHAADNRTHQVWRAFRSTLDGYSPPRTAVGEVWATGTDHTLYARPDEFPMTFNFAFLQAGWDATALRAAIDAALLRRGAVGATAAWVTDNHDTARSATRLGPGVIGLNRSRAMMLIMLALPGTVYLYQGQELGLPNVDDLPDSVLQDPIWARSGFTDRGRDGCRVPLPWSGDEPPFGFTGGRSVSTWLPQPAAFSSLTVSVQLRDPDSTLAFTRRLVQVRRARPELRGGSLAWLNDNSDRLDFERVCAGARVRVVANLGGEPIRLPAGAVLAASSPDVRGGMLPPDAAVWLAE